MFKTSNKIGKMFLVGAAVILLMATCSALTGCVEEGKYNVDGTHQAGVVTRWHDEELPVTCWTYRRRGSGGGAAISCIPDRLIND